MRNKIKLIIKALQLQLLVLQLQLRIKLFKQKLTVPNLPEPRYVVVHYGGGDWGFKQVNNYHRRRWGFRSSLGYYIGYHKWIEYSGKLYTARRDNEEGAHCVNPDRPGWWNRNSVGICIRGMIPTDDQLETLRKELNKYKQRGFIIRCHRDIVPTLCPGESLYQLIQREYY